MSYTFYALLFPRRGYLLCFTVSDGGVEQVFRPAVKLINLRLQPLRYVLRVGRRDLVLAF